MLKSTEHAIMLSVQTVLTMATEISEAEKHDLLKRIRKAVHGEMTAADFAPEVTVRRPMRLSEVKAITGLSAPSIHRYAQQGKFERVYFGDSTRASGFTAESVEEFLKGKSKH